MLGPQPSPAWHWFVAFCGVFVLLAAGDGRDGRDASGDGARRSLQLRGRGVSIAALYAGNTFGAVLGVLATVFVLVPELGLARTAAVCAALNFLCAAAAVRVFDAPTAVRAAAVPARAPAGVLTVLAATGLLGIGYEVLVVRVVSQVAENTVYTFAILLAVYLVGTALGAAAYARWRPRSSAAARTRDRLLQAAAAACLLGTLILAAAEPIKAFAQRALGPAHGGGDRERGRGRDRGVPGARGRHGRALQPPVHAGRCRPASASAAHSASTLSAPRSHRSFSVSGCCPRSARSLRWRSSPRVTPRSRRGARGRTRTQWLAAGAVFALAAWAPALVIVDVPEGGRIVSYREGVMAAVSVVEDALGVARLHIDNRQQEGSSATVLADARQALLPILLHPAPRRALFLGLGTGVTASAAAQDPLLEVDAVELLPEVIAASAYFAQGAAPRLHLLVADARRYVRTTREDYDVIVADNFHPARSGSGSLYTVEHFAAVRERLARGGLFCQWLPLHQLDLDTLRSITRTFLAVYPHGAAVLATNSLDTPVVGLVARRDGELFDVHEVRARLHAGETTLRQSEFGIADDLALLGSFVAGPRALERFAAGAPLNTDDRPVVAYRAPRITYVADSAPRDRLIALLRSVDIDADELLAAPVDTAWGARLAAYRSARDRFVAAGRDVRPTSDVRGMLAQVREPLLAVLEASPDFRPAYDPLLRMAVALGRDDAAAARALLADLERVQPDRPEAAQARRDLTPGP